MRSISRRDFIVASGAAATAGVLAGCGGGGFGSAFDAGPRGDVAALSREHFDTLVGMPFLFEDREGQTHWLDLEDVMTPSRDPEYPADEAFRDPFSLIFQGEHDVLLDEGSYAVMHPAFDMFDLHVIPRMPGDDGSRHEIIFT